MDLKEIQNFIRFATRTGASEIKLETKNLKLSIRTGSDSSNSSDGGKMIVSPFIQPPPTPQVETNQGGQTPNKSLENTLEEKTDDKYITIKSPMIGTFYRRSAPDQDSFVEVGSVVKEGSVLCVIEAMKLFNEIESEVSGKIVKILVDDSSPVEFDEPLFLIDPS